MADPAAYFLAADRVDNDQYFLAPARAGATVTPFVDGIETFRAMERAIAGATRSVHLAAWILDPDVPLQAAREVRSVLVKRSGGAKSTPTVENWGDLLATVAGLGVEVCVLLSDFDPVLQPAMHREAWSSCRKLQARGKATAKGHLQVMASLHQHVLGGFVAEFAAARLARKLEADLNKGGRAEAAAKFNDMPRAWRFITRNPSTGRFSISSSPSNGNLVSHHQKICIVDRLDAFCGGLDVKSGRLDTKSFHTMGWHDLHCRVNGQLAADLERNFIARWNAELPAANSFITSATAPVAKRADKLKPIMMPTGSVPVGTGQATCQLLRTVTRPRDDDLPAVERDDILRAYERAIGLAEQFVYLESQYVRDIRLADSLASRAKVKPGLAVILILPIAPEEICNLAVPPAPCNPAKDTDEGTKHGLYLQRKVLDKLLTLPNFRAYSMLQRSASKVPKHPTNYLSSAQVYVHSKAMIVDDTWATIGSANANPRSFAVDTEANIAWVDPAGVKRLRLDLWREMLGSPGDIAAWNPANYLARWDAVAKANKQAAPAARKGYVVPHDHTNLQDVQQKSLVVPDQYAEIDEINPDPHVLV